jgi:hypothetical protein
MSMRQQTLQLPIRKGKVGQTLTLNPLPMVKRYQARGYRTSNFKPHRRNRAMALSHHRLEAQEPWALQIRCLQYPGPQMPSGHHLSGARRMNWSQALRPVIKRTMILAPYQRHHLLLSGCISTRQVKTIVVPLVLMPAHF